MSKYFNTFFLGMSGLLLFLVTLGAEFKHFQVYNWVLALFMGLICVYNPLNLKNIKIWSFSALVCAFISFAVMSPLISLSLFLLFLLSGVCLTHFEMKSPLDYGKLIILSGSVFNLFVILVTRATDIQYDFASCFNYIEFILDQNFLFWQENPMHSYPSYSSYHPILHFFLGALVWRVGSFVLDNSEALTEALQILFWCYMFWYYCLADKILKLFHFKTYTYLCCLAFVCLFPLYNAIAGFYNNDCLLLPLQAAVIYYSLLYFQSGGRKNLFFIWLFATLGALTKLSLILVLPFTGVILLLRLFQHKKDLLEIIIFGLCLGLGLAIWPLYQYFVLDLDFGFVPPQEHLSLASYSYFERFNPLGAFFYSDMFYHDFGINLWETMTKTALFGQWDFSYRIQPFGYLLTALVGIYKVILATLIIGCGWLVYQKKLGLTGFLIGGILIGHICFGLVHPYMCNQDFRYVAILVLPLSILFGKIADTWPHPIRRILYGLVIFFTLLSAFCWVYAVRPLIS